MQLNEMTLSNNGITPSEESKYRNKYKSKCKIQEIGGVLVTGIWVHVGLHGFVLATESNEDGQHHPLCQ